MNWRDYDVRTLPTVKAGIKVHRQSKDNVEYVEYEPGNGTKYRLLFTPLNSRLDLSFTDRAVLVTLMDGLGRGPVSAVTDRFNGYLSVEYVRALFGFPAGCHSGTTADVIVLTELIAYILDRQTELLGPNMLSLAKNGPADAWEEWEGMGHD